MAEERNFANLVATVTIDMPQKEQQKLDAVQEQAPRMEKAFGAFARGGAAIFAAFSAVALLFGAGGGFRAIIDLLFQTVSLLTSVLLAPFIKKFVDIARETKKEARDIEERGFFTPERIGALVAGGIVAGVLAAFTGAGAATIVGAGLATAFLLALADSKFWTGVKQVLSGIFKASLGLLMAPFTDQLGIFFEGLHDIWNGLKNIGLSIWGKLPAQFRNALTTAATFAMDRLKIGANWLKGAGRIAANWIMTNINPVQWAMDFVNWLRSVNWSSVFTFDIPGIETGVGGGGGEGTDVMGWLGDKWDAVEGSVS